MALTDVPAVSRLLWSEFLDDHTPDWFTALPTDVQKYLSGEFGPSSTSASTTASSTTPVSSTASATSSTPAASEATTKADTSSTKHDGGLPLWAKIVIGVVVPLVVLALLALLLLCCLRRRRRNRTVRNNVDSRAPTPAFISSSHQPGYSRPPAEHVPLRGGYISSSETTHQTSHSNHHHNLSSGSEDFHTPIGGPSYEDIPSATPGAMSRSRRGSRQSFNSLHSVPEVPEPVHNRNRHSLGSGLPIPPPPHSSRRSRDLSEEQDLNHSPVSSNSNGRRISPLNPAYGGTGTERDRSSHVPDTNPYMNHTIGQDIYAGGQHPYPAHNNPFADPSPPRQPGYMASGGYRGSAGPDPELFMPGSNYDPNWPLRAMHESGYDTHERTRKGSWERGDDPGRGVYEL